MKISVIIPVYNVEQYVVQCLQSVADQTWDGEIECIIVDDCGTDASMEKVDEFLSLYDGSIDFKVIRHEKNRGLSAARNTGVEVSSGDYIYFLDSDDSITPKCLEILVGKVSDYPDVQLVHGKMKSIPYKKYYDRKALESIDYLGDNASIRNLIFDLSINATDKLISSAFYHANSLRFRDGVIHEDQLWSYYLYDSISSVAFVHETTYLHIIRQGSIMTTLDVEKERKNWSSILMELSHVIKDPCFSRLERYFLLQFIHHYDGDEVWNPVLESFTGKMRRSNDFISRLMLKHSLDDKGPFYKNWFRYTLDRSPVVRLFCAVSHGIKYCLTIHTA